MLLALSQCLLLVYLVTGLPESLVFLELLVVLAPKHYTDVDVVAPCFLTPGVQDDGIFPLHFLFTFSTPVEPSCPPGFFVLVLQLLLGFIRLH